MGGGGVKKKDCRENKRKRLVQTQRLDTLMMKAYMMGT